MANTSLGTLNVPLLAQRTLEYLAMVFPPVMRFFIAPSNQLVLKGQEIKTSIPIPGAAYTPDLTAANPWVAPGVNATPVSVTANTVIANSILLTVNELSQTDRNLVEDYAPGVAGALGIGIITEFMKVVKAANFATEVEKSAVNYDDDFLRKMRKIAGAARWPVVGRLAVVNGDAYEALTGDQVLLDSSGHRLSSELIEVGLPSVNMRTFEVMEFPEFDTCKEAGETDMNGFFMTPGAIVAALGVPLDSNLPGFPSSAPATVGASIATDPNTGFSLLVREARLASGHFQLDFAVIMGTAKGDATRLQRIIEQPEEES